MCVVLFFLEEGKGGCGGEGLLGRDPLEYLHIIFLALFSQAQQSDETAADVTAFNAAAPLPVKADTPACMNQLDTERTGFLCLTCRFTAESRDNQHKWRSERWLDAG